MVSVLLVVRPMRLLLIFGLSLAVIACDASEDSVDTGRDDGDVSIDGGIETDGGAGQDAGSGQDAGVARDSGVPRDAGPEDGGESSDAGEQPGACPDGSPLVHYSLAAPASLPSISDLNLPNVPMTFNIVPAGEGTSDSVRFDICDTSNGPVLHALLWRGESFGSPHHYVVDPSLVTPEDEFVEIPEGFVRQIRLPTSNAIVEGLADAVAGDPSSLRIRLVFDSGLLVQGHADFVAVARGRVDLSTIEYTSVSIIVGVITEGNVFEDMECGFGQSPSSASFEMGTASFEVELCTFLGGGITTGYNIVYLAVEDTNAALTPAEQQRIELTTREEVEAVMNYVWNHHNACDSFHLALPHADYAASAAPAAGCGATVPNAPERDFNEPSNSPTKYSIRYHGGAWTEGTIPGCPHYLFCN